MQSETYIKAWLASGNAYKGVMAARTLVRKRKAAEERAFFIWAFTCSTLGTEKQFISLHKASTATGHAVAALAVAEADFERCQDLRTAVACEESNG